MSFTTYRLPHVLLVALLALYGSGCDGGEEPPGDDTTQPGDDDTTTGDDDTTTGDDDATTGDDDATTGDDDTASGDDDATSGDDDAQPGDDDATSGDDDAQPGDDDATGGDDDAQPGDDDATAGDDDATSGDDDDTPPNALYTVYELNQTPPANQTGVITSGIITAIDRKNNFWIEAAGGGLYSGIYVYAEKAYPSTSPLPFAIGDEVEVLGWFQTYYDLREIAVYSDSGHVALVQGGAGLPPQLTVELGDLVGNACATGTSSQSEPYVGVLLNVPYATVLATAGACSSDPKYGQWEIQDATGSILMDDETTVAYTPTVNDTIEVAGVLTYTFSQYKINPTSVEEVLPPGYTPIYDLNESPPLKGTSILTQGVVTGIDYKGSFWIQDSAGGPYSGIYVYDPASLGLAAGMGPGDLVQVSGEFGNYYGQREIEVSDGSVTLLSAATVFPEPLTIEDLEDLDVAEPTLCDASSANAEPYVGVLLETPTVTGKNLECADEAPYGVWEVFDTTSFYPLLIDDNIEYSYDPSEFPVGEYLALTGILAYSDSQYRLNPIGNDGFTFYF